MGGAANQNAIPASSSTAQGRYSNFVGGSNLFPDRSSAPVDRAKFLGNDIPGIMDATRMNVDPRTMNQRQMPEQFQQGQNIYDQSSQALTGALNTAQQGTNFQAPQGQAAQMQAALMGSTGYDAAPANSQGYNAQQAAGVQNIQEQSLTAGQLGETDLTNYQNQYDTGVIDLAMGDIERNRQIQQTNDAAKATAANAFGGSRQGIADAETNRAFAEQAAKTSTGLRQQGFANAQQQAQADINRSLQAGLANQGANLQAQTTSAANDLSTQFQNQNAGNQASQFGAQAANTASLANQAAQNQAAQFGAQAANNAASNNQGALNSAGALNMGAQNAMTNTNMNNILQGNSMQQNAGAQLGALSQQGFNMGNNLQQTQYNQGLLQQGMNQSLIDAAKGQYGNFVNAPYNSLQYPMAAITGSPQPSTTTNTQNPGLFNYLSLPFMYGAR